MVIKAPAWLGKTGATPTLRGWEAKGELLKSERHTQAQLDEYWGVSSTPDPIEIIQPIEPVKPKKRAKKKVAVVEVPEEVVAAELDPEDTSGA